MHRSRFTAHVLVLALVLASLATILTACGNTGTTPDPTPTSGMTTAATQNTMATTLATTADSGMTGGTTGQAGTQIPATSGSASVQPAASAGGIPPGSPLTADDLVLTIDGQPFAMLSDSAPLFARLGSQYEMTQAESCVYEGFDKTFDYGFLEVYTIPDGKADLLDGIYLADDRYRTARGIKVGDPVSQVFAAYGDPPAGADPVYNKSGDPENLSEPNLTFIIENDRVAAISYYSGSNAQGAASR